jgi:hypothetical protein
MTNGRSANHALHAKGKDGLDAFLDAPVETTRRDGRNGRGKDGRGKDGRGRR